MKKILLIQLSKWIPKVWYCSSPWIKIFAPLSWVFQSIVKTRRLFYHFFKGLTTQLPVPVIVVGNVTVGGVGKTPVVIQIAKWFKESGLKPGIISRGYGGTSKHYPLMVSENSDPKVVGDEVLLLVHHTQCPVAIAPDRVVAAELLLQQYDIDIILSDDGLQHYALHRDIEIVVIDGSRGYGNRLCLPVGPLREPISRVDEADFVILNGLNQTQEKFKNSFYEMTVHPKHFVNCVDSHRMETAEYFKGKSLHAVAAIGNPDRFFQTLRNMGLVFTEHAFPDHTNFKKSDLEFSKDAWIVMTEKDAVKCHGIVHANSWYLSIDVEIENGFKEKLLERVRAESRT